jgi:hypothetical protein
VKIRKKPIELEAFKVPDTLDDATGSTPPWVVTAIVAGKLRPVDFGGVDVDTPTGPTRANVGDFIVQGARGELYPCRAEDFADLYEEVDAG